MPATPDKLSKNLPRLAGFNALQMTLFPVAIITLYQSRELGLDMTEIMPISDPRGRIK